MSGGMESMIADEFLAAQIERAEQQEDFALAETGDDVPVHPLDVQVGGDHYKKYAIQPIEYIIANGLDFCAGSIVKYVTRYQDKGGNEDLDKIIHYAQLMKAMAGEK